MPRKIVLDSLCHNVIVYCASEPVMGLRNSCEKNTLFDYFIHNGKPLCRGFYTGPVHRGIRMPAVQPAAHRWGSPPDGSARLLCGCLPCIVRYPKLRCGNTPRGLYPVNREKLAGCPLLLDRSPLRSGLRSQRTVCPMASPGGSAAKNTDLPYASLPAALIPVFPFRSQ